MTYEKLGFTETGNTNLLDKSPVKNTDKKSVISRVNNIKFDECKKIIKMNKLFSTNIETGKKTDVGGCGGDLINSNPFTNVLPGEGRSDDGGGGGGGGGLNNCNPFLNNSNPFLVSESNSNNPFALCTDTKIFSSNNKSDTKNPFNNNNNGGSGGGGGGDGGSSGSNAIGNHHNNNGTGGHNNHNNNNSCKHLEKITETEDKNNSSSSSDKNGGDNISKEIKIGISQSKSISPFVSPVSSPRSSRSRFFKESRRISIEKTGHHLHLNQYRLLDSIGEVSKSKR